LYSISLGSWKRDSTWAARKPIEQTSTNDDDDGTRRTVQRNHGTQSNIPSYAVIVTPSEYEASPSFIRENATSDHFEQGRSHATIAIRLDYRGSASDCLSTGRSS
jgi:hypothetical protein